MSEWKEEMSPVLLVLRDVQGHVFGAVTSTALRPSDHYYGTGDSCLLFRFTGEYPHTRWVNFVQNCISSITNKISRELRTYNWTGNNQFFVNATKDFLSVGAGGGHYGLWLDADLNNGRSQKCATFDNEPLAGGLSEDFVIQFVEAFGFSMWWFLQTNTLTKNKFPHFALIFSFSFYGQLWTTDKILKKNISISHFEN